VKKILNEWKMFLLKEQQENQSMNLFKQNLKTYPGELKNNDHTTAVFNGFMDCRRAKYLKGKNNEHKKWDFQRGSGEGQGRYTMEQWEKLKQDVKNNGFKNEVFCVIEWDGDKIIGRVYEGNHRIRIGCQLEMPIPVEIKFFGKAEEYIEYGTFDYDFLTLIESGLVPSPPTDRG
jgi:hypothetical protein